MRTPHPLVSSASVIARWRAGTEALPGRACGAQPPRRPSHARFVLGVLLVLAPVLQAAGLAGPFAWTSTAPLMSPIRDATHPIVSMKDPTVVYHGGKWHVYATTADVGGNWSMAYLSFRTWAEASAAQPYYLDQNPSLRGYHCAPQVFYFRPQQKWYLI